MQRESGFATSRLDLDSTVTRPPWASHHAAYQVQSESASRVHPDRAFLPSEERFENVGQVRKGDSRPIVCNADEYGVRIAATCLNLYSSEGPAAPVFDRIAQ